MCSLGQFAIYCFNSVKALVACSVNVNVLTLNKSVRGVASVAYPLMNFLEKPERPRNPHNAKSERG